MYYSQRAGSRRARTGMTGGYNFMQEYRRQIAYLYAYDQGVKMRSTGVVKMDMRGESCRLGIHLKSYCCSGEPAGKAYIYFYHQNRTVCIYLGELENRNGALEWQGTVDPENILGKGVRAADTKGVWIRRPGERNYVAEWDDYPVDISRFILYPKGGQKCIQCPWFGNCERSSESAFDRRGKIYERSHPAGA